MGEMWERFPTGEKELIAHGQKVEADAKIATVEESTLAAWVARTLHPHGAEVIVWDPRHNESVHRDAFLQTPDRFPDKQTARRRLSARTILEPGRCRAALRATSSFFPAGCARRWRRIRVAGRSSLSGSSRRHPAAPGSRRE
jgi:hypothetical protein